MSTIDLVNWRKDISIKIKSTTELMPDQWGELGGKWEGELTDRWTSKWKTWSMIADSWTKWLRFVLWLNALLSHCLTLRETGNPMFQVISWSSDASSHFMLQEELRFLTLIIKGFCQSTFHDIWTSNTDLTILSSIKHSSSLEMYYLQRNHDNDS